MLEELKAEKETQFKLLDLAERKTGKLIARNRASKIERHLTFKSCREETGNDTRHEIRRIYGFQ